MGTKVIGIGCDDYKVDKFKTALEDAGYSDLNVTPIATGALLISITVDENLFASATAQIYRICKRIQEQYNPRRN